MSLIGLRYRGAWVGSIWMLVLAIVAASLWPNAGPPMEGGVDKLGHFGVYLVLALLGAGIVEAERAWLVMVRAILLGVALEAAQALLTETRTAEWADALANATGVLAAWWLVRDGRAGWARDAEAWLARRRKH